MALGSVAGAPAVRATAARQCVLVAPGAGLRPYGGVGLTFAAVQDARSAGYLALMLGVEGSPGKGRGWYLEAGVEGGVRVAGGLCWRFPTPRKPRKHEGRSLERPDGFRSDLRRELSPSRPQA